MLGSEMDGGGSEPKTTVQDSVSTCLSAKPLNVFNKTSGRFPVEFVATEPGIEAKS